MPYLEWKPNVSSTLLKVSKDSYKELFGKDSSKVLAIHAGLECGLIGEKDPKIEIVSFGPTIKDAHSINERVETLKRGMKTRHLRMIAIGGAISSGFSLFPGLY